jgi:uncharacterized protein (DUF2235 family)
MSSTRRDGTKRDSFVLCFDGTGNTYTGDERDSNVLRIYRLLDRSEPKQYSWYNAGLGTYIEAPNTNASNPYNKVKSAWIKTNDLAFGANVGEHVMAGYKYVLRMPA